MGIDHSNPYIRTQCVILYIHPYRVDGGQLTTPGLTDTEIQYYAGK